MLPFLFRFYSCLMWRWLAGSRFSRCKRVVEHESRLYAIQVPLLAWKRGHTPNLIGCQLFIFTKFDDTDKWDGVQWYSESYFIYLQQSPDIAGKNLQLQSTGNNDDCKLYYRIVGKFWERSRITSFNLYSEGMHFLNKLTTTLHME